MYTNDDKRLQDDSILCTAGYDFYIIRIGGKITRCWSHPDDVTLGSIKDKTLYTPKSPFCSQKYCSDTCEYRKVTTSRNGIVHIGEDIPQEHVCFNIAPPQRRFIRFMVALEQRCNYRCPYCMSMSNTCPDEVIEYMRNGINTTHWVEWWRWVKEQGFESVSVQLTGGEPLVHPGFREIALSVSELNGNHELCTNLSLDNKLCDFISGKIRGWLIFASAHPSNESFNIDHFIDTVNRLKQYHNVVVIFVDVVENASWKKDVIKALTDHNIKYSLRKDERHIRSKDRIAFSSLIDKITKNALQQSSQHRRYSVVS